MLLLFAFCCYILIELLYKIPLKDTLPEPEIEAKASLSSDTFLGSDSPLCVTFWFHMYHARNNRSIGTLNVVRHDISTRNDEILWSLSNGQSNEDREN